MREEYEIQLIDETSGEQIKTVSPTVESHTVYHGEKKLSGYLEQVEKQSKLYAGFGATISMVKTGMAKGEIYSPRNANLILSEDKLKIQPTSFDGRTIFKTPTPSKKLYLKLDVLESSTLRGFNVVGVGEDDVQKTSPVWITPKMNEITLESDHLLSGFALNVSGTEKFVDIGVNKTIWGSVDVPANTSFTSWLDEMTKLNIENKDTMELQSKSNLVLVTTMQKLLSEKIEELERELIISQKCKLNYATTYNAFKPSGRDYVNVRKREEGDYPLGKYLAEGEVVFFKMGGDLEKPSVNFHIGDLMKATPVTEGKFQTTFEVNHSGQNWLMSMGTWRGNSNPSEGMLLNLKLTFMNSDKESVHVFYRNPKIIQEELDFYKSQLEKLKLTQEVDLNLLLTL